MPSHEQVKHALKHPKEFRQLISDINEFQAALEHVDLRVKLFMHLVSHPKSMHKIVNNFSDFQKLIQMDWDYLQTTECNNVTAQGLLLEKLVEDRDLLNKVIKDRANLGSIAYLIKCAPLTEEKKVRLQVQVIEKLITIENKLLDIYHPQTGDTTRNCQSGPLAHDRSEWAAEAFALLAKMEVEQLFPIIFAEFRDDNFRNHNNFRGTLEDMRLRWKTFDKTAYEFCITELQTILNLPTMKEPIYRNYLVGFLEDCERSRPMDVASLLDPELQYKMKIDPCYETYPPGVFEAFLASQQKKGLLQPIPTGATTTASTTREPSPIPTGLPQPVKSS